MTRVAYMVNWNHPYPVFTAPYRMDWLDYAADDSGVHVFDLRVKK